MKELLQSSNAAQANKSVKRLHLFIRGTEHEFVGDWQWNLHCDAVFCSDVMLRLPDYFEGTRGIIHPDDKAIVLDWLDSDAQKAAGIGATATVVFIAG